MASPYVRRLNAVVAVRAETTPGVDAFGQAGPDPAVDFFRAEVTPNLTQQQIPNPETTGSLDAAAPIPGGTRGQVAIGCVLRGSGGAATPPRWGRLMPACTWEEVVNAAGTAATAATVGGADRVTLPTPYAAADQTYRGMPVVLRGNPVGPFVTLISDYTARVARLVHTFTPPLDTTTTAQIPPHVLWRPNSDPAAQNTATIYFYCDGLLWRFTGCAGSWDLDLTAGAIGRINFQMQGQFVGSFAAPVPTGIVFDGRDQDGRDLQPPVFRDGICRLDRRLARASRLTVSGGVQLYDPENPEAVEGYDSSVATGRQSSGSLDPLMNVTDTLQRTNDFRNGTAMSLGAALGGRPGNRFGFVVPQAQLTGSSPTNRNNLMAETLPFSATGINSSLYLTQF